MGARDGSRKVNPQIKVENPLQLIADNFDTKAVEGLVGVKEIKRFYNKATTEFTEGRISKVEFRSHLKSILEDSYSSENLNEVERQKASEKRAEIVEMVRAQAEEIAKTAPSVQVNYHFVSEKIEKKEPLKAEHIAAALTTLHVDLLENKVDSVEAQKHLNGYMSYPLEKDSMEAKIREQLVQSYSKNFVKRGLEFEGAASVAAPAVKNQATPV